MNGALTSPCTPQSINSWFDLQRLCPTDPRELLAYAAIAGSVGAHDFSLKLY